MREVGTEWKRVSLFFLYAVHVLLPQLSPSLSLSASF
jgi:hypothetical protein